ncbi:MAG TPA: intradiol ring-cleavage dioxygenase [Thermoanaerobaculia bacterium]
MNYALTAPLALLLSVALACAQESRSQVSAPCPECGASEAPAKLDWRMTIAGSGEPGERLELEGIVYRSDGKTPAANVVVFAYHTNAAGVYPGRTERSRHGALRGWLRTGDRGRYAISTIRPGTYPTRSDPAHIHVTVAPPGVAEYWIDEIIFDDDPLVTKAYRARLRNIGGSGIVHVTRDKDGVWRGRRKIMLARP